MAHPNDDDNMIGGVHKLQTAYFCSECGNLYDITNTPPDEQKSEQNVGDNGSHMDKNKTKIDSAKRIYFVCTTCGNTEMVKPKTCVFSKKSAEISKEYFGNKIDSDVMANSQLLLHTRDYICPNKTCTTHASPETRDAVMSRFGNSYKIVYTCTICKTMWK